MKILFNTHPFAFQHPGGGEVIMERLKSHLEQMGHNVDYFDFYSTRISDYDLVHHFSTIDTLMWSYYKKIGIPFVLTPTHWPRTGQIYRMKYNVKYFMKKLFNRHHNDLRYQLQFADHFTPTTTLEATLLQKLYKISESQTTVITNGVDLKQREYKNRFTTEFNIQKYYLCVGNISAVKNIDKLIEQFNRIDYPLIIVGDASADNLDYLDYCKSIASQNIHFLGRLPLNGEGADLNDLYHNAQAVIIPSQFETCSLVALEAAVRSTPVLLTQNGGTKEVFQDKVWYIDPNHLQDLDQLLERVERGEYDTDALKQFVEQEYSWHNVCEKLLKVYKKVLKE